MPSSAAKRPPQPKPRTVDPTPETRRKLTTEQLTKLGQDLEHSTAQTLARLGGEAPERSDVQTSKRSIVRRVGYLRADGSRTPARDMKRQTIYLPPVQAQRLKQAADAEGVAMSDVISRALAAAGIGEVGV